MHWFFKVWLGLLVVISTLIFILFIRPKLLPTVNISNSEKYGFITQNERWSGTIWVTGDIWAFPGTRIDVAQGTQILVANSGDRFNLDKLPIDQRAGVNDSASAIFGIRPGEPFLDEGQKISMRFNRFYALGSKEQPVIIESAAKNRSPYDFNTFSISEGVLAHTQLANFRRLEIGAVTVQNSTISDIGECLCVNRSNPDILDNTFSHALRDYIWVYMGSPLIQGDMFLPTKGNGIVVNPNRLGSPKIIGNQFQLPGYSAVLFLTGSEKVGGLIANNLFAAGEITIPCDSKVTIVNNHIKSNLRFIKSGNCVGSFNVGANYWEINNPAEVVKERIIGTEPNFKVVMDQVLKQSPPDIAK